MNSAKSKQEQCMQAILLCLWESSFMCRYQKRVLTFGVLVLGVVTLLSNVVFAGPDDFFVSEKKSSKPTISCITYNQQVANKIAGKLRGAQLKGYDIQVEYQNGTATLTGQVTGSSQKRKVEQIVRKISDVKHVKNQLTLVSKKQLRSSIQQASATKPAPQMMEHPGAILPHNVYNHPNMPRYAWPQYAAPFSSSSYPYYSITSSPYINHQVPLGWETEKNSTEVE